MRAVSADGKLDLEQEFIRLRSDRPVRVSILAAHLTELARPIRQDGRPPAIAQLCVRWTVRPVEADAGEPPPRHLIFGRHVETAAALDTIRLLAAAPDHLGTADERVI